MMCQSPSRCRFKYSDGIIQGMSVHMPTVPEKKDRRVALVVVDAQNKFFVGASEQAIRGKEAHVPVIAEAVRMFHEAGRPVVFVLYDGVTHYMDRNTAEGDAIFEGIDARPDDIYVHKYHMNSFRNTCLEDVVKEAGCDSVLLCGMYTDFCVMSTYWSAIDHGLTAFLLKGALIATEERVNEMYSELCKTFDMAEVEDNLRNVKTVPCPKDPMEDRGGYCRCARLYLQAVKDKESKREVGLMEKAGGTDLVVVNHLPKDEIARTEIDEDGRFIVKVLPQELRNKETLIHETVHIPQCIDPKRPKKEKEIVKESTTNKDLEALNEALVGAESLSRVDRLNIDQNGYHVYLGHIGNRTI